MRKILVCGDPHCGKSVLLTILTASLPPGLFYLCFAAPDGEWHWTNLGDQGLVQVIRQKGKFDDNYTSSMLQSIESNQSPLLLVDTGGRMSEYNERLFALCDGAITLTKDSERRVAWREFAERHGVRVIAELDSSLVGESELYADRGDGVIRGRVCGLEREEEKRVTSSPILDAVVEMLRGVIRINAVASEEELTANINGLSLLDYLGVADRNDPFLGVRPAHLPHALKLMAGAAKLPVVKIYNVRAAILASAYAAKLPGEVELFSVSEKYVRIPDVEPHGEGTGEGVEWEMLALPEVTLVKYRPTCFVTGPMLSGINPPQVDTAKPVVLVHDGPPMTLDATIVRAYARTGVPWVGQFWPVESGREQTAGGKRWDETHPFAGPAVVVAGPEEKVGEVFPISFDLLRWGTTVMGWLTGGELVVDRKDSHAQTHPAVHAHIAETLLRIRSGGRERFCKSVDFGHNIGETICVETSRSDEIVFAQRPHRKGLTRFVKNRRPQPTTQVSACFQRITGGAYLLLTAFVGPRAPAEPWDKFATEDSVAFWNSHALVWGVEETIPGTETNECPW